MSDEHRAVMQANRDDDGDVPQLQPSAANYSLPWWTGSTDLMRSAPSIKLAGPDAFWEVRSVKDQTNDIRGDRLPKWC